MKLTRTQKKQQDLVLASWLDDHGIPSMDEFLDYYHVIKMTDPSIIDDLYTTLEATVGLLIPRTKAGV